MYFEWITRLFRAAKAPASRLAEDPIVPPADPGVDSAIFDLRSIAEYPLDQRQPLAPELQRDLARLSALMSARARRDANHLMPLPLLAPAGNAPNQACPGLIWRAHLLRISGQ